MKRLNIRKLLAALCLALALCASSTVVPPAGMTPFSTAQAAAKVKLNKTKATIYNGKTLQLKLNNAKGSVTWKSSNKKVATVSNKGKVTAKKAGTATITATNGKKKYTCKVTVKPSMEFLYNKPEYELTTLRNPGLVVRFNLYPDKTAKLKCKIDSTQIKYTLEHDTTYA